MKLHTVVVGIDGSENARRALEAAIDLVAEDGMVHLVSAFHAPSPAESSRVLEAMPEEFRSTYDALAAPRANLTEAEALLAAQNVPAKSHFVEDHPAAAILDVAKQVGADMVVVGSRGLGRTTRFLRGSVSSRVASHAKSNFMVIHDDAAHD